MKKARRQVARAHERDAPHGCKREHVVHGAMRGAIRTYAEGVGEVGEAVGPQTRQPDSHELKRIEPLSEERVTARDTLQKRAVEAHVVRDDVSTADEVDQTRHDALHGRCTDEHVA